MSDLPPLPEGFKLDAAASEPPLPAGFARDSVAPERPPYSGTVLPISRDAGGNISFDSNAGLLGLAKRAFTLPGDVYTGKTPILVDGRYNPDLINRSMELAGLISPVNPAMRAGELMGSRVLPQRVATPSAKQLKAVGGAGFDEARQSGLEFHPEAVAGMANNLRSALEAKGIIAERAPDTHALLNRLTSPPAAAPDSRTFSTIDNLMSSREAFAEVARDYGAKGADRLAATRSIRAIDDFLENPRPASIAASGVADPSVVGAIQKAARGNYAAAQRSNTLTGDLDKATTGILERAENRAQATNSGNLDNAIRQRSASLLEKPREISGYSNAEIAALEKVLQGGPARNAARYVGNPSLARQAVTAGLGAVAGGAMGDSTGAAIGAAAPTAIGAFAKMVENWLAKRSLGQADDIVRQNSPLYRSMQASAPRAVVNLDRDAAVLRALSALAVEDNSRQPREPATQYSWPTGAY